MQRPFDISGVTALPPLAAAAGSECLFSGTLIPTLNSDASDLVNALSGATVVGTAERDQLPWKQVAEWTHGLAKTPTDRWLDLVDGATRGSWHRWQHHHPFDFGAAWLKQGLSGELSIKHYVKHVALDAITIRGIPLLPEKAHTFLVSLGVSPATLFEWTHVNIFDLALGAVSFGTGGYELFLAVTGHLPWGLHAVIVTFGLGTAEIVAGCYAANPLFLVGGAMKIGAGCVSLWQHVAMPVPDAAARLADALPTIISGAAGGAVACALRLAFRWNSTTAPEKAVVAAESLSLGTTIGLLSSVSAWASVPVSLAYSVGKLAFSIAKAENAYWDELPYSTSLGDDAMRRIGGEDAVRAFDQYLASRPRLQLSPDVQAFLNDVPTLVKMPDDTRHVFERRQSVAPFTHSVRAP